MNILLLRRSFVFSFSFFFDADCEFDFKIRRPMEENIEQTEIYDISAPDASPPVSFFLQIAVRRVRVTIVRKKRRAGWRARRFLILRFCVPSRERRRGRDDSGRHGRIPGGKKREQISHESRNKCRRGSGDLSGETAHGFCAENREALVNCFVSSLLYIRRRRADLSRRRRRRDRAYRKSKLMRLICRPK